MSCLWLLLSRSSFDRRGPCWRLPSLQRQILQTSLLDSFFIQKYFLIALFNPDKSLAGQLRITLDLSITLNIQDLLIVPAASATSYRVNCIGCKWPEYFFVSLRPMNC